MFECHVCGATESHVEYVSEVFLVDDRRVLIEQIPARICNRCGEATFSRSTTERVRLMVHGEAEPVGTVEMEVFAFA
jgi:HTH-type transcriptional regulator / antitoxin MqsA